MYNQTGFKISCRQKCKSAQYVLNALPLPWALRTVHLSFKESAHLNIKHLAKHTPNVGLKMPNHQMYVVRLQDEAELFGENSHRQK